jgi:hypothetical protein
LAVSFDCWFTWKPLLSSFFWPPHHLHWSCRSPLVNIFPLFSQSFLLWWSTICPPTSTVIHHLPTIIWTLSITPIHHQHHYLQDLHHPHHHAYPAYQDLWTCWIRWELDQAMALECLGAVWEEILPSSVSSSLHPSTLSSSSRCLPSSRLYLKTGVPSILQCLQVLASSQDTLKTCFLCWFVYVFGIGFFVWFA